MAPSPHADLSGERSRYERDELLAISRALASERDIRKLLDLILRKGREITGADAGSVYVVESEEPASGPHGTDGRAGWRRPTPVVMAAPARLHFMLSQNDSMPVDFQELTLHIDGTSMSGRAALTGKPINVPDLSATGEYNRSFDEQTGYRARSMLTVPLVSTKGDVVGVIQLINKKRRSELKLTTPADFDDNVIPFGAASEEMAVALAAQAGVALENAILYDEIRQLFEGFVDASVTAIEARDPTTSGHSRRVATLTVALAQTVDEIGDGPFASIHFSRDDLRQLEYAGVLHDFGKVAVRENVLVKAKKLYDWQLEVIRLRFAYVRKCLEAESLSQQLQFMRGASSVTACDLADIERQRDARIAALEDCWHLVLTANEPSVLDQPAIARLGEMASWTYLDAAGVSQPYLTATELAALQVPRGSLTPSERQQIERHVSHTLAFLQTIPWGRSLRRVPEIAGSHHEFLDGTGYPGGLRGDQIPVESRMLTIADMFDALTASDRPYKAAVPVPRALAIIESDVKSGKCDAELFRVFVDSQIYKKVI
jgi:HD-GYP domain-containing protein (c-di-GMP phosphodiesterase class II)